MILERLQLCCGVLSQRAGMRRALHPGTAGPQRARLPALRGPASGWQQAMAEKRELLIITSNPNRVLGYCKQAKSRLNAAITNPQIILWWNRIKRHHNPTSRQSDVFRFYSRWLLLFCKYYFLKLFIWCVFVCYILLITDRWKRSTKSDVRDFWDRKEVFKKKKKRKLKRQQRRAPCSSFKPSPSSPQLPTCLQSVFKITASFPSWGSFCFSFWNLKSLKWCQKCCVWKAEISARTTLCLQVCPVLLSCSFHLVQAEEVTECSSASWDEGIPSV